MRLAGRTIAITGASRGLGAAMAQAFVAEGAEVLMGARSAIRLPTGAGRALAAPLDVSDAGSIDAFVARAESEWGRLDVLVNNAGAHGAIGALDECDLEQWMAAVQVNLFGTVAMCKRALPALRASARGKIINLSGGGAATPRPRFGAYAASKAAVVRFGECLAAELGDRMDVNSLAPGALPTDLLKEVVAAGAARVGQKAVDDARRVLAGPGEALAAAVELAVFLAGPDSDGITGRLLSAVWDPWRDLARPEQKSALAGSDVYTLRRIVPSPSPSPSTPGR